MAANGSSMTSTRLASSSVTRPRSQAANILVSAATDRRFSFPAARDIPPAPRVLGSMSLVTDSEELPGSVLAAHERAARAGFQLACEAEVGRLLAALAAAVPDGGRVLEIGTGVGVGLAWLVQGLGARRDVEVVTVEVEDEVQGTALSAPWPPWVRFKSGDGAEVVGRRGQFDLIFPDAPRWKDLQAAPDRGRALPWRRARC